MIEDSAPLPSPLNRKSLGRRIVKTVVAGCEIVALVQLFACGSARPPQIPLAAASLAGRWQYQERAVWIEIRPTGEVFQCRIGPGRTGKIVYRSKGRVYPNGKIHWDEIWPVDIAKLEGGNLVLSSRNGTFTLVRTTRDFDPSCEALTEPTPTPASTSVQLHVIGSVLTSGENFSRSKRIPTQSFGPHDYIVFVVDMGSDNPDVGAGKHDVEWRWYLNEKLVSRAAKTLTFATTPFPLWTNRAASALGAGHCKVETVVDGRVVASSEFDITQ